jgi:hypothetical protein
MEDETAGDPMTGLKWTKKTTKKIAEQLHLININISPNKVGDLLKELDYSLRVNCKKSEATTKVEPQEREQQFCYIKQLRQEYQAKNYPTISVDCKKKETIGNFKNSGQTWRKQAHEVNVYDFPSLAIGVGIPYGIFDICLNFGFVVVGVSYDTPEFAVNALNKWYQQYGSIQYRHQEHLLILADGGGSNSSRSRMWKYAIQEKLCNQYGLTVTVCHYPPGNSQYNPIERRLFSQITRNLMGTPLASHETILKYIKRTSTKTGLKVDALLDEQLYEKGITISDEQMAKLSIKSHDVFQKWNYTIFPQ